MLISKNLKSGFTLIELLLAASISIMLMTVASTVLVNFMVGQVKNSNTRLVKNEGDHALFSIKSMLTNAIDIAENSDLVTCETGMSKIAIEDNEGYITEYAAVLDDDVYKIASTSVNFPTGAFLNSESVSLIDLGAGQYLNFDCVASPNGQSKYVTIKFGMRKGEPGLDRAYEVSENYFTTGVSLRN